MGRTDFRRALVLGGIKSGKSEYAEGLLAGAGRVRYLATARRDPADPDWEARIDAHRDRRPEAWITTEVGDDPLALLEALATANPGEALLVEDLGTWVTAALFASEFPPSLLPTRLAAAVRACSSALVIVSPEVGLSLVPMTPAGRSFVDALGAVNQAVAAECDTVALVIAGNAVPVKGGR